MVHQLPIPTPFAVGRVNCYLVEDDPLTLVDCGPNSGTALTQLERALGEHGHRVEDLQRIVLTHQHIDHIGLAGILAERSGAEVCALAGLAPWLAAYSENMEADDRFAEQIMLRHGIGADVTAALRSVVAMARAWGARVDVTHTVVDGDVLEFADRRWTVLHRPGHSPSDTVFHDAERRELIGGDHLIGHISSNPVVSRPLEGGDVEDRPKSLVVYLESLAQTAAMDLDRVLPGHGSVFGEHAELVAERRRLHERRARKIHGLLADEPLTAHEIAHRLWGDVAVTQAYLTLSEVLGHTDLLEADGRAVARMDDDVIRFAAT